MKIIKILALSLIPFFIQSMDKNSNKRAPLFQSLILQLHNEKVQYKPISDKDIEELKKELIVINEDGKRAEISDLKSCIRYYNELYKNHKNDKNNIYFLDTILPVLFEGHDFSQIHRYKDYYGTNTEPQDLFIIGKTNTYLLSSLIYIHGISIKSFDHYYDRMTFDYHFISSILHNIRFMVNSENYYEEKAQNKIEYLKAIFTPPASWIKEAQKNVMPTMGTFMLCLYRLKQQQPASFSIPKRLMNSCIVPLIIKNTIDQKTLARCNTVNANLQESVDFMRKGGYREGDNIVTDFLYNELGQWLEQNTNICQILYNTLMNPR